MSPVEPPIQETAAWLDQAVTSARALCGRHRGSSQQDSGLAEKNGLRALLNFAQGTESTDEVILFIEYQAVRMPKFRQPFLRGVAEECRKDVWSGDIQRLRRFLGVLVRAGIVARETLPRKSPPGQGGDRDRPGAPPRNGPSRSGPPRGGQPRGGPARDGQSRREPSRPERRF